MQPTTDLHPQTPPSAGGGAPGTTRWSKVFFDERGIRRQSDRSVPVDQYGRITGVEYRCPKCRESQWFPAAAVSRGAPVCEADDRQMTRREIGKPPVLPWGPIWRTLDMRLRAVWVGAAVAGVGELANTGHVPPAAAAFAAPLVGVAAWRVAESRMLARSEKRSRIDPDAPRSDKRIRAAIARRARAVGYCATAGCAWTALAAGVGLDPHAGGRVMWPALVAAWLPAAATWWRHIRADKPAQPVVEIEVVEDEGPPPLDPDEAQTRRIWSTIVAARKGQVIGRTADERQVLAPRSGKLAETRLEDWHKVVGGWAATAVGPDGAYVADQFLAARPAVASAFRMKTSMITCVPDPDDENRALYLAQRTSPIGDVVRWSGPESIDVERGVAPVALYADGEPVMYEIYRPGWGVPHVGAFGTTGSGKSEFINQIFTIDRWAHHQNEQGAKVGIVADFLVDPQQGQSYAPFLDELAAPVADSLDAALLLVRSLHAEMLRRNRYLAREAKTWDEKRGKWRRGRKWWNPLLDGPILALTIDEAHLYLANREFAALVIGAARMWRKCGGQLRIATHTPLLSDLGGSMALRDMLTSGFVWVGRVANSLTGPTAFNGRLPADPRTIPGTPGAAYILTGLEPKAMLARTMWEPDYYDWVRDNEDEQIGYPAVLPPETLAAFGPEYAQWAEAARAGDGLWTPAATATAAEAPVPSKCVDSVLSVLACSTGPMDMDALDTALRGNGWTYSTRTVRDALKKLRDAGLAFTSNGRHELTPQARADIDGQFADKLEEAARRDTEGEV